MMYSGSFEENSIYELIYKGADMVGIGQRRLCGSRGNVIRAGT